MLDITGQKFGRLTAIKEVGKDNRHALWLFKCDCGNETITRSASARNGNTKSCGCLQREKAAQIGLQHLEAACNASRTHGRSKERIYRIYKGMKYRCCNPNNTSYSRYGGKGITVCDEWLSDPQAFISWALTHGYKDNLTIDRKDGTKGYSPDNCRWLTISDQQSNKCTNMLITMNNETKTASEWAKYFKINVSTFMSRLRRGWSFEESSEIVPRSISAGNT